MTDLDALRAHLIANLFDGGESGTVTAPIATFATEVAEVVGEYLDAAARPAGLREALERCIEAGDLALDAVHALGKPADGPSITLVSATKPLRHAVTEARAALAQDGPK